MTIGIGGYAIEHFDEDDACGVVCDERFSYHVGGHVGFVLLLKPTSNWQRAYASPTILEGFGHGVALTVCVVCSYCENVEHVVWASYRCGTEHLHYAAGSWKAIYTLGNKAT